LLILSNKRTFEAFRIYLASIFCIENLDFFVVVAQYKKAIKQRQKSSEVGKKRGHHTKNVLSHMSSKIIHAIIPLNSSPSESTEHLPFEHVKSETMDSETLGDEKNGNVIDRKRTSSIKNVVHSGRGLLNEFICHKDANDLITSMDPKDLRFDYLQTNEKLKDLDIDEWAKWIYDEYVSDSVINIAYGTMSELQTYFENENDDAVDGANIFDNAQHEVWMLMINDSLSHFKRTEKYKQLRSFFETNTIDLSDDIVSNKKQQTFVD